MNNWIPIGKDLPDFGEASGDVLVSQENGKVICAKFEGTQFWHIYTGNKLLTVTAWQHKPKAYKSNEELVDAPKMKSKPRSHDEIPRDRWLEHTGSGKEVNPDR